MKHYTNRDYHSCQRTDNEDPHVYAALWNASASLQNQNPTNSKRFRGDLICLEYRCEWRRFAMKQTRPLSIQVVINSSCSSINVDQMIKGSTSVYYSWIWCGLWNDSLDKFGMQRCGTSHRRYTEMEMGKSLFGNRRILSFDMTLQHDKSICVLSWCFTYFWQRTQTWVEWISAGACKYTAVFHLRCFVSRLTEAAVNWQLSRQTCVSWF